MRVKSVPEPPGSIDALGAIRRAVPLVPEPEASCCDRLAASTAIDPEAASDWLTFLKGLELVRESESGFHRTREDPDLGEALLSGVYGAREVREILEEAGEVLAAEEVAERFDAIPRWERHHHRDPEAVWRERVERLLDWLVLVGLAERRDGEYVSRSGSRR
ncbi:hypothetical protein [Halalkalicoccus tibetensis]|uniref:Uncharacterized protein n=1 Tax=Halalkalicoccus tibetensis TaxID=175632 RepID=A0ABD5UXL1_9EURY